MYVPAPVSAVDAKFEWLLSSGSLLLIAGVLVVPFLGVKLKTAVKTYGETLYHLRWTIVTVSSVVGLAYVMNLSGQIITLGMWAAGAGGAFAPISPLIGWLGLHFWRRYLTPGWRLPAPPVPVPS